MVLISNNVLFLWQIWLQGTQTAKTIRLSTSLMGGSERKGGPTKPDHSVSITE